jgi:hypothetical protein
MKILNRENLLLLLILSLIAHNIVLHLDVMAVLEKNKGSHGLC